jgi:hypothetical protein
MPSIYPLTGLKILRGIYIISNPKSPSNSNKDNLDDKALDVSIGWWYKLELVVLEFRSFCLKYWVLGLNLSIDEIMVWFFGRSKYTFKAPNKPIKEGYKIFALCEASYIYYFM